MPRKKGSKNKIKKSLPKKLQSLQDPLSQGEALLKKGKETGDEAMIQKGEEIIAQIENR